MSDEGHIPGNADKEFAATEPEQPTQPEAPKEETPNEPEAPKEEPKEEVPAAAEEPKPETPEPISKPRSIYDDLKDKKKEAKEAAAEAAAEKARADAAEARAAELQALLDKKDDAKTTAAKADVDAEIAAYAQAHDLDPAALDGLVKLIEGKIPKAEIPEHLKGLKPEDVEAWRKDQESRKLADEDRAIDAQAPAIRTQLKELGHEVHDEAEFATVMNRVKELSHTKEFHDKEIDYIVFRNRAELAKSISPKKPSFEGGGQHGESEAPADVDYNGVPTPGQMASEVTKRSGSAIEIRRGS